jgi:hypothetical protein
MIDRKVTERDFRRPEFSDANPEDYEFRRDGKIVRKDRWKRGIEKIAFRLLGENSRAEYEIDNLVVAIEWLLEQVPDRGKLKEER